jgi:hypothetical protein
MAHARKSDFVFRRNGRVRLNRRGRQFSRLPAVEACASAVVMLDTPCSEVVWRVMATHSIRQFPLHFLSCASPCAITFQLDFITFDCVLLRYKEQRIKAIFIYAYDQFIPEKDFVKKHSVSFSARAHIPTFLLLNTLRTGIFFLYIYHRSLIRSEVTFP